MFKYAGLKFSSPFYISVLLVFITFAVYANILPNKLFFDDEELIYKNAYVSNLRYLPKYFTTNMIAGAGKTSNMYRPILTASFAIDHLFWGSNPFGYHLTSILLHAANGILVFFLIYKLFKDKLAAFLTAVFFIIHPVQSEAVIYASGRTDLLYSFFGLSGILSFLLTLERQKNRPIWYLVSIFFFILSILSKETAIVIPLILMVIYFVYPKNMKNNILKPVDLLFSFFVLDIIYVFLRLTILNFADTLNFYTTVNIYSNHLFVRLFTFAYVFFQYLFMLVFPKDLIFSRQFKIINFPTDPWVISFLVFILTSFIFLHWFKAKNRLFPFAFCWFFLFILPVSGIIPINSIIAEHYLYLPSVSFFLLISSLFVKILDKIHTPNKKSLFMVTVAVILLLLSLRTIIRTFDWRDAITFYSTSLKQSPWNIPMRNNLAMAYAENGQLDSAINEYKMIIGKNDVYPNVHHNLGNAYKTLGKYKEAETEYKKALEMDPKFYFSLYALADLYQKTGESDKLEEITARIKEINLR